ncbi:MAG: hypothetical protein ACRD3V_02365, partial [Vicinamibacteria bacterium]
LRYCFGDVSTVEVIQQDHVGKMTTLVGDGGSITVEYLDADGELKTIRREVQGWETEREVRDSGGNVSSIIEEPAFFSQGELVQIAASLIAQMELIDRQIDVSAETSEEAELVAALRKNAIEFVRADERSRALKGEVEHPETGKVATETQVKALEQKLKDPVFKEFPAWEAEQRYLEALDKGLAELPERVAGVIDELDFESARVVPPQGSPSGATLASFGNVGARVEAAAKRMAEDFQKAVEGIRQELARAKAKILPRFEEKKAAHQRLLAALGESDERKAQARYRTLTKRVETLTQNEQELARTDARWAQVLRERNALLDRLDAVRRSRWEKRNAKAKEYEARLEGVVRVSVVQSGDLKEYEKRIRELQRRGYL